MSLGVRHIPRLDGCRRTDQWLDRLSSWATVQGTAATALAISYPAVPGRGCYIFLGIISVIAGIVVLAWPFDSIVVLALVTGIWLVVIGIAEIITSFDARRAGKAVKHGIKRSPTPPLDRTWLGILPYRGGGCMTGCRYVAKNTLVKNYLGLAGKAGAEVFRCEL